MLTANDAIVFKVLVDDSGLPAASTGAAAALHAERTLIRSRSNA